MAKWLVVADSVRCRLYEKELVHSDYCEKQDWIHPAGRVHDSEVMSDRPGSDNGAVGQGRHPMLSKTDPKEHEKDLFAHEICGQLEKARKQGLFSHLVLIAPPAFLGKLRSEMSDELGKMVVSEINKDLTKYTAREVQDYIKQAKL